jgi:tRNA(Ile)-lysidine synthase
MCLTSFEPAAFINMDLLQKFKRNWQTQFCHLSPVNCEFLLAVSGGLDSVVLVDLIHRAGFQYHIAHGNFQLRGDESERDEKFVRSLGEKYGKEVLVKKFDTKAYASENKISIQEAARDIRYTWFKQVIDSWRITKNQSADTCVPSPGNYILTAHHADDNVETLLMHFFRGTGIQGLTGIQPLSEKRQLIRPLLVFRKKELLDYANERELDFVEDSSNASDKYTRNFFRNQLLPQIKEVFPQVEDNLLKNIERFGEATELYRQSVNTHKNKLLEQKGNEWHIPVLKWKSVQPLHSITWELIKTFGFHAAQTDQVIKLLDAENGSYQSSGTHRIIRNRKWMIISPNSTETAQHIVIEEDDKRIAFENGALQMQMLLNSADDGIQFNNQDPNGEAFLHADEIVFPLLLRKWKTGDYFYPLGMQKKKKIGKFLIDMKLAKTEKEKVWVLESNQKIIWVIGYRIDNRFRITDQTKQLLHIRLLF